MVLLRNPKRIQSAAINLAVATYGDYFENLIRIDAHGDYPEDYCDRLIAEAAATGADSVVVSMATKGVGVFQKATAAAQNSKLGNGGSPHREGAKGHWTDHGHHALMRVAAFRAVGGYDESFSHNEDAELDYRLAAAGYRIWMTDKTFMVYYPRASVGSLFRQYLGYGRGRAKNILKHHTLPKIRQAIPLLVFPVVAGASLAFLNLAALIPAGLWIAACIGYGVWMAVGQRNPVRPAGRIFGDGHASRLVAGLLAAASDATQARGRGVMSSLSQNPQAWQTRIDICVCTYRRPELELTLRSLGALEAPPDATRADHRCRQ